MFQHVLFLLKKYILDSYVWYNPGSISDSTGKSPKLVLVPRAFYVEKEIKIPVKNKSEVNSILLASKEPACLALTRIGRWDGKNTSVYQWEMEPRVAEFYHDSYFFIPESWLYGKFSTEDNATKITTDKGCLIAWVEDGVVRSVAANTFMDEERLLHLKPKLQLIDLDLDYNQTTVRQLILNLPVKDLLASFNNKKLLGIEKTFCVLSIFTFVFSFAMILLFSVFLLFIDKSIEQDIYILNEKYTGDVQAVVESARQKSELLAQFDNNMQSKRYSSYIWLVIHEMLDKMDVITNVSTQGPEIFISGNSANAISSLNRVKSLEFVSEADFSTAIRKNSGVEYFVIRVSFKVL